jgi:hypothetical protein
MLAPMNGEESGARTALLGMVTPLVTEVSRS